MESEEDEIKSKQASKKDRTLLRFTYFFLLAANGIAKRVNKLPENPTTALITHQIPANTL